MKKGISKAKLMANLLVVGVVLFLGIKLYSYINHPVYILRDVKSIGRYVESRNKRLRYELRKEQRGQFIADVMDVGDMFNDTRDSLKKMLTF